jgi:hypothetical protein
VIGRSGLVGVLRLFRLPRLSRLLGLSSVLLISGCGQKGPPLAPIVYLPRPVTEVVAKRIENDVVIQFTVPTLNTDNTGPADLRKIEVYAHTGPLPAPADFLKYGTLVASIPIKKPKSAEELKAEEEAKSKQGLVAPKQGAEDAAKADATGAAPAAPMARRADPQDGMIEQGWKTTVRETLTPTHMEIGPMPPTRPVPAPETPVVVERVETPGTVNFDLAPQRYYVVTGFSDSRNRPGPFAGPIQIALLEPSSPPEKVDVTYTADAVSLTWPRQPEDLPEMPAATGALGATGALDATAAAPPPVLGPVDRETEGTVELYADVETEATADVLVAVAAEKIAAGVKPKPRPAVTPPPPPVPRFGYNVYELGATTATGANATGAMGATPAPSALNAAIAPLNATLLTAPRFADPRVEFGVERCYVVRRVEMAGPIAIESAPSGPVCVTPVDTFPPAAPKSLAHIAAGNGVSLLWEANTEPDLGGYLVLRGEAPGDKLSLLTPAPITETSFLDSTVSRGRTYVYEVVAVDRSTPPNQSAPSNRVEETIR